MSLKEKLDQTRMSFQQNADQSIQSVMNEATQALKKSDITSKAPKPGQKLAEFTLPDQNNQPVSLTQLLGKGAIIVTFYRGGWCPYCNLELREYQQILTQIKQAGASLVAITPELPDASLSTSEKNSLDFKILSDVEANYARTLGLVFTLPEALRPIYANFGIHIEKHNGRKQFDLPLAATFVINAEGIIVSAWVDADYTRRQEPEEVVSIIQSMK